MLNNFENVITNIFVTFGENLSKCNVSMSKIKKKFWEIFDKIVHDLESFTFMLSLNLLFTIVPEDSSSRWLTGLFSKKKRVPRFIQ